MPSHLDDAVAHLKRAQRWNGAAAFFLALYGAALVAGGVADLWVRWRGGAL